MKSDGHARKYRGKSEKDGVEPKTKNSKRHAFVSVSPQGSGAEGENPFSAGPVGPHAKKMAKLTGWIPNMEQVQAHVPDKIPATGYKQLSAKQMSAARKNPLPNIFYFNPYQDYDYIVLQDMYMNSIAGRIVDLFVSFMFGQKGVKPILKLKKPNTEKPEEDTKLIKKYQYVIDELMDVDKSLEKRKNRLTYSTQVKFKALVKRAMIYGRAMIAYDYIENDPQLPFYKGKKEIPNVLKSIHPRDMGLIRQDTNSWDLNGVTIRWYSEIYEPEDMLYMEHEPESAIFRGGFYGLSFMQSMIGPSRTLRSLLDRVMPQYAKTNWTSRALVIFKKKGTAEDDPNDELSEIAPMFLNGEIALGIEDDPHEDVAVHNLDVSPDIDHLVKAIELHVKYIMAQAGVPQALLYDEGNINLATLIGKMREFADQVHSKQLWAAEIIGSQHYNRDFEVLYDEAGKERELFTVSAEFDKIKVDSWQDSVKALRHLRAIMGLSDKASAELIGIDNIEDKLDPNAPIIDGGGNSNKLNQTSTTVPGDSGI